MNDRTNETRQSERANFETLIPCDCFVNVNILRLLFMWKGGIIRNYISHFYLSVFTLFRSIARMSKRVCACKRVHTIHKQDIFTSKRIWGPRMTRARVLERERGVSLVDSSTTTTSTIITAAAATATIKPDWMCILHPFNIYVYIYLAGWQQ